jgi:malate dehydrogenase (oxaloacetate-decarboxylating)
MPVMEGKSVFYRRCAGLSAVPILIDTEDIDEFVETVVRIAPGFGGIHLEDIRVPDCFEIESRLIDALDIPVMHDDVHGTAVATLAAELVACKQVGIDYCDAVVGQIGLGAAGFGIAALAVDAGAKRVVAFDPDGSSHARAQSYGIEMVSFEEVLATADLVVATTGRPGLITEAHVRKGSVIFALSNPYPEIHPDAALAAGAAFAADGTSVNNVLGFPGLFRGALTTGSRQISTGMKLAAAHAIARLSEAAELVPDVLDPRVHEEVTKAVAEAAIAEGLARPERIAVGL